LRLALRLSAAENSLATFCGIPIFLANAGLCAAARMVRACLRDVLGIGLSYRTKIAPYPNSAQHVTNA